MTDPSNNYDAGRPPTLDEKKRRKILAILANGSSRRVAARVVGCAHSTIARTAQRDPAFAAELDAAEHCAEIEALRLIRDAARNQRYWRAAAWLLERRNPSDFAARSPELLNKDVTAELFARFVTPIVRNLPDAEIERIYNEFAEALRAIEQYPEIVERLKNPPPPRPTCDMLCPPEDPHFAPRTAEANPEVEKNEPPQPTDVQRLPTDSSAAPEPQP
jgi:hypothetical protein